MGDKQNRDQHGFTLIELIAVLVIMGVLFAVVAPRLVPQSSLPLQGARDLLVLAILSAQQQALSRSAPVRLLTQDNRIDIRIDSNGDGIFSADESLRLPGSHYPLLLPANIALSTHQLDFNSLGHTASTVLRLSRGEAHTQVQVTETGYAY